MFLQCIPLHIVYAAHVDCQAFFTIVMLTVTPTDYKEQTLLLMFSSCETRKCTSVAINNDNMTEETEFFRVSLERTTTLDSRIALSPNNATVHIADNDGKHFASAPPSVTYMLFCCGQIYHNHIDCT